MALEKASHPLEQRDVTSVDILVIFLANVQIVLLQRAKGKSMNYVWNERTIGPMQLLLHTLQRQIQGQVGGGKNANYMDEMITSSRARTTAKARENQKV